MAKHTPRKTDRRRRDVRGGSQSAEPRPAWSAQQTAGSGTRKGPENPTERDANDVVHEYYERDEPPAEEVRDIFADSQSTASTNVLRRKLSQNPNGPDISAEDVDAAWDRPDEGEETVGGSSPTPDQDIVEEIGEAVGVTYQDTEPLRMEEKLVKRDDSRWELDPASDEEYVERVKEQKELEKEIERKKIRR